MKIYKNTFELNINDVVSSHGLLFKLTNKPSIKHPEDAVVFETMCLGFAQGCTHTNMPKHWQDSWTIQGNDLAIWEVII